MIRTTRRAPEAFGDALGIIDMQRGFMPVSEGERLGARGFGELPVPDGHTIIPVINELTVASRAMNWLIFDTADAHPPETAHFSDTPNYINTWPRHCVRYTPGSYLHPDLLIRSNEREFRSFGFDKGVHAALTPEEDDSYSAANAYHYSLDIHLTSFLPAYDIGRLTLVGVALGDGKENPLCVDSSAIDFLGFGYDVRIVTDAVKPVLPENRDICFRNLARLGVELVTSAEILGEMRRAS